MISYCVRCNDSFDDNEPMACTGENEFWHIDCFVCAQCFRSFGKNLEYYNFNGRYYCERDFRILFGPCCADCNESIIGRFIRALDRCWHPNCFKCNKCSIPLADMGFVKFNNEALCYSCHSKEVMANLKKHICHRCKSLIEPEKDGEPLRYKNELYHAYHFNCCNCGIELRSLDARNVKNDLYCIKCHDKREEVHVCGACRQPIEEERVVIALGKHWHPHHFACASCERPFLGKKHYELKGLAYCEMDYRRLFGHVCHACEQLIRGPIISALGKFYCDNHFNCSLCRTQFLPNKTKFFDVESNPCCKKCYKKLPGNYRKRLAKQQKLERKLANANAKQETN